MVGTVVSYTIYLKSFLIFPFYSNAVCNKLSQTLKKVLHQNTAVREAMILFLLGINSRVQERV